MRLFFPLDEQKTKYKETIKKGKKGGKGKDEKKTKYKEKRKYGKKGKKGREEAVRIIRQAEMIL